DRVVDSLLVDAVKFKVFLIDRKTQPFARRLERVVHIDDKIHLAKGFAHLDRRGSPFGFAGSIDFGAKRREDRRSGRHFNHLDNCSGWHWQTGETSPDVERDGMARARPLAFWKQVDLEIALGWTASEIGMPDEAVEIERRGGSRISLDGGKFRQVLEPVRRGRQ